MSKQPIVNWMCVGVLAFPLLACGDSGGNDAGGAANGGTPDAASSGDGGPGPVVGNTDAGGGATGGGATGGGGSDPGRVVCGGVGGFICTESIELMGRTLGPCCDEDSGNICGAGFGSACEGLHQAGDVTDECPSETSVGGENLAGCCRPDGRCGVWIAAGFGCVERGDVMEIGVGPFDARSCGSGPPPDAGAAPADGGGP